uniref:zinc finger BED domain-containing protein DAYSLEEPER-like isoform X2 n=1 Tax=Erigeron canadensis TaxID=72917 RepID=UPI001CB8CE27|nr:zinc finger BED domain-containing protein DAYSLEEPER-like isoform X2 [Erigeron canadensis]
MDLAHVIVAEEDRISKLSDAIIHRILAFVGMKDAIRTSKISRRWRHIWTTLPYLNLDTSEFHSLPQFTEFVRHLLSRRNNNALVSTVKLNTTGTPAHVAVRNVINSRTLKHLTLTSIPGRCRQTCVETVSGWDFPSLETLNLTNIYFKADKILNPFSMCVNLKNLTLDGFSMFEVGIFIIYAPQLSNLTITKPFGLPKLINVVAPQLQNLTASVTDGCSPYSMLQLLTEGFNSLEKVKLSSHQKIHVPLLVDMYHMFCSATVLTLDKHVFEAISLCLDKFSLERCPFNNLKCLKVLGVVSCYPTRAKNYLLENSPNATFLMDSPQVPQKILREPIPNDGMANKVEAENKQAGTMDKVKRVWEAKIPTICKVGELRSKIQTLERTKWQLVELMPHVIKGKMAELKLQVESGNPNYDRVSWIGSEFKSLLQLIPKCARLTVVAHFSSMYKKMKRLSHTYINAKQWAKIEAKLGHFEDSEKVYSDNIQIRSDDLTTDIAPTPSLTNDGNTFLDKTQCEQVDADLKDNTEEVETVEPISKESRQLKRKRAIQEKVMKEGNEWSACWQYFEKVYKNQLDGVKKKYGKCKRCKKLIEAEPIINGTPGLKKHFISCEVNPEVRASKGVSIVFNKDASGEGSSSINVWSHDDLAIKEALLDFFVCAEVPFKLVEHWAFVRMVYQLNGKVKLPSRHKLSKDIAKYYLEERSKLFLYLSDPKTTIHLTTDTWTSSCQKVNYMVVTAHFIDENWVMHKRIINFRPIESHSGDDIGPELLRCIDCWGIQNVMTITLDNASSNDKAIEYLLKELPNLYDKGKHFHVRCMAHILNLIVKDALRSQTHHVERVQKAIRYIRRSTQRITKFKECMEKEKIESEMFLCLDYPTRWNSTYEMLKNAVGLQKIFSKYQSVDQCYRRDLVRLPDRDDFNACEKVVLFLEKFKDKTEILSATSKPLSHLFLREVLDVDYHLRVWERDIDFCNIAGQLREKFDNYWGRLDKLNDYFYFAVILDPTMKSVFVRHCFRVVITNAITKENPMSITFVEKMVGVLAGDVENRLGKLFETYEARFGPGGSESQEACNEEDAVKSQGKNDFFADYLHMEGHALFPTETELIRYLHEPEVNFEPGFDILKWWSLNENRFPIVAHMARDILAIQISSVASESAFRMSRGMLDPYRTRLSTNIVEALICTQDWVRKSSNSIYMDQVEDILNDDDIAIEIEEAINNQKDKGKEQMLVEE